jgi:hypothetical protein
LSNLCIYITCVLIYCFCSYFFFSIIKTASAAEFVEMVVRVSSNLVTQAQRHASNSQRQLQHQLQLEQQQQQQSSAATVGGGGGVAGDNTAIVSGGRQSSSSSLAKQHATIAQAAAQSIQRSAFTAFEVAMTVMMVMAMV